MNRRSAIKTRNDLRALADANGYIRKAGRPVLRIYADGTILRADADLSVCRAMTVKEAAKVLSK